MKKHTWLILFLVTLISDLVAVQFNYKIAEYIFKPLLLIWLLAYFILQVRPVQSNFKKWITAALVFSWLGDVLLMLQEDDQLFFLLGLSAFLIAHIFYFFILYG